MVIFNGYVKLPEGMLTVARVFKKNLKRLLRPLRIFDWIPHRWLWMLVDEPVTKSAGQLTYSNESTRLTPKFLGQYRGPGLEISEESLNDSKTTQLF